MTSCSSGEEDGLVGARYYTANPFIPPEQTIAYAKFDLQGTNSLPAFEVCNRCGASAIAWVEDQYVIPSKRGRPSTAFWLICATGIQVRLLCRY